MDNDTLDREPIFEALKALAQEVNWGTEEAPETFRVVTRRIKLFSDVPAEEQPWLGQAEHNELISQRTNLPYRHILEVSWMVYHKEGEQPDAVPTILNNRILKAVEDALAPKVDDPGFFDKRNTLRGLVHHCFIDGTAFKDPGDIDNQALMMIPIRILVP